MSQNLEKIDFFMREFIAEFDCDEALKMFDELSSGKKLRSKLLLNIAGINESSLRLCAIIELIQAASLLHDDVIDESDTRRGKPSINATYGSKNAVMLGDILYSKAFFELTKFDKFVAGCISESVAKLSVGELIDVKMGESFNDDEKKYLNMIYLKTAALIESSAMSGAFLADLNTTKFGEYGKNLGIAFQIIDDILDITKDSVKLGKPALNDFKEGKTTLPYIYLYENLQVNDKEKLKSLFGKELNSQESAWIKAKFGEFKIIEKCINLAKTYGEKALQSVSEFKNEKLNEIVLNMINREF
ncbi:MAG: polyprenyl synthetase family protein [Campylobacter sp.]|nr:polyprenyl synthetase family protein [Campylobacter sp.]